MEPGSKSTIDIFQAFIDSRLADVHTSIPGEIVSYNNSTGLASVKPLVRLKRKVNEQILTIQIPQIDNVPVITLSTASFILDFPIKKGDGCAVFFSEVGIGNFINGAVETDPDNASRFNLTDAFCIPGLHSRAKKPIGTPTIKLDSLGNLSFLSGIESFVKGETLETLLTNFLTPISAIVPGDVTANAIALGVIKVAATALLATLSTMKSLTIKGE